MESLTFKLEVFEGPLDLLLHLISKNKLNIYDIPVSELVDQYMEYINQMQRFDMDIASEFLEMAARLIYLKTVSLLPKHEEAEQLKQELTQELIEYKIYQEAAKTLSQSTDGFDTFVRPPAQIELPKTYQLKHEPEALVEAYLDAVGRGLRKLPPPVSVFGNIVRRKIVPVSAKIVYVLRKLWSGKKKRLLFLFEESRNRSDIVATFLAVLELIKANRVEVCGQGENAQIKILKERA
ncbi:MAG TPA: segregation/condensation protein A [Clostridiales bacterium]|nr:segregation/condensation protein A [Clostridiales bacterium]